MHTSLLGQVKESPYRAFAIGASGALIGCAASNSLIGTLVGTGIAALAIRTGSLVLSPYDTKRTVVQALAFAALKKGLENIVGVHPFLALVPSAFLVSKFFESELQVLWVVPCTLAPSIPPIINLMMQHKSLAASICLIGIGLLQTGYVGSGIASSIIAKNFSKFKKSISEIWHIVPMTGLIFYIDSMLWPKHYAYLGLIPLVAAITGIVTLRKAFFQLREEKKRLERTRVSPNRRDNEQRVRALLDERNQAIAILRRERTDLERRLRQAQAQAQRGAPQRVRSAIIAASDADRMEPFSRQLRQQQDADSELARVRATLRREERMARDAAEEFAREDLQRVRTPSISDSDGESGSEPPRPSAPGMAITILDEFRERQVTESPLHILGLMQTLMRNQSEPPSSPAIQLNPADAIPEWVHEDPVFKQFICGITRCPISDPVLDPTDKKTLYERTAIENWLMQQQTSGRPTTSPLTRQPLKKEDLIPLPKLKALIQHRLSFYKGELARIGAQLPTESVVAEAKKEADDLKLDLFKESKTPERKEIKK